MSPTGQYWTSILASHSRRLHVGMTNDLGRRVSEHRAGVGSAFAKRYNISRLVHYEEFRTARDASAREKEIKAWRREKKVRLIERFNAGWLDLAPEASGG